MKIENIKKSGSKYKIKLDNGEIITTYDNVILNNSLLYSKNIDKELLEKITTDTLYYKSYNKALDMISRRLRSEKEIREYLKKSEVPQNDTEKIITELKNIGLINDYNFAKAYTNDKINLSYDGPYKIRKVLQNHQIEENIIEDVIQAIDKEIIDNNLDKIINKKLKTDINISAQAFKQKLTNYLINLGYSKSDINNHLENIQITSTAKEIEKIYNKLSAKYKGEELIFKLKNKLYSKGYKTEEINNFIEKQF